LNIGWRKSPSNSGLFCTGWSHTREGMGGGDFRIPYDGWDAAKNEFTIILLEPNVEHSYTFEFVADIAFGEIEGLSGKPVIPVLDHFGRYAQFVIVQLLEETDKLMGI
jgi:hypothetical protein